MNIWEVFYFMVTANVAIEHKYFRKWKLIYLLTKLGFMNFFVPIEN